MSSRIILFISCICMFAQGAPPPAETLETWLGHGGLNATQFTKSFKSTCLDLKDLIDERQSTVTADPRNAQLFHVVFRRNDGHLIGKVDVSRKQSLIFNPHFETNADLESFFVRLYGHFVDTSSSANRTQVDLVRSLLHSALTHGQLVVFAPAQPSLVVYPPKSELRGSEVVIVPTELPGERPWRNPSEKLTVFGYRAFVASPNSVHFSREGSLDYTEVDGKLFLTSLMSSHSAFQVKTEGNTAEVDFVANGLYSRYLMRGKTRLRHRSFLRKFVADAFPQATHFHFIESSGRETSWLDVPSDINCRDLYLKLKGAG